MGVDLFLKVGWWLSFSAFGPPAGDASQEHEEAAEPDEGNERIDEDADGGLRWAIPVGEEDIEVGQVMCGD